MIRLLAFLLMASMAWPAAQKYRQTPALLDDEINNIYLEINKVPNHIGVTDGSNAEAGCYGEFVSSSTTAANTYDTTAVYENYLTITLSPGDWDVTGRIQFNTASSANTTSVAVAISSYSANTTTDHVWGTNEFFWNNAFSADHLGYFTIPVYRVSTTSAKDFYLKSYAAFGSGAPNMRTGSLTARRIR